MNDRIIVVDDDRDYLSILVGKLLEVGYSEVDAQDDARQAAVQIEKGGPYDIALIDMTMPGMDGMQLLERIKQISPTTECIMVTAVNDARVAVECLKKGAYDYLIKPVTKEDLMLATYRAVERKRLWTIVDLDKRPRPPALSNKDAFKAIITQSPKMLRVLKEAELHASSNAPILVTGESGTGKELLARAIHRASPRNRHTFTPVNMASVSATLFEAEFFGHTKGAFTGANTDRDGYIKHTDHGTLFLDEIGNLPMELQGKLLRFLQDGEYIRIGSNFRQTADVRLIAATNANLEKRMTDGTFRKDLYYRIRGGWLHLPPLRERKEDIATLVQAFYKEFSPPDNSFQATEAAMEILTDYGWPGNIRELRSIIQSAVNLAQGKPLARRFLPKQLRRKKGTSKSTTASDRFSILPLAAVEKDHILKTYRYADRNKSQTARLLGIGLNTLRRRLRVYGID
ncbi:MAG: sigma-54 dependent transcriptional regulator [Desulfobacterales bacterium]|nr:sigma-54 dependent transcriptional regulator [Desulfobacterales bacterium]